MQFAKTNEAKRYDPTDTDRDSYLSHLAKLAELKALHTDLLEKLVAVQAGARPELPHKGCIISCQACDGIVRRCTQNAERTATRRLAKCEAEIAIVSEALHAAWLDQEEVL